LIDRSTSRIEFAQKRKERSREIATAFELIFFHCSLASFRVNAALEELHLAPRTSPFHERRHRNLLGRSLLFLLSLPSFFLLFVRSHFSAIRSRTRSRCLRSRDSREPARVMALLIASRSYRASATLGIPIRSTLRAAIKNQFHALESVDARKTLHGYRGFATKSSRKFFVGYRRN